MNCNIIGLKFGMNNVGVQWLLRKYGINIKEVQKDLPKYYVYIHKHRGKVFYVGSAQGDPRRIWTLNRRSDIWTEFVESVNYDYDAEIIEVCENRFQSHSREHYWGCLYKDKGEAQLWMEDVRGCRNPASSEEVIKKIQKSKAITYIKRNEQFRDEFIKNNKEEKIVNTGRNRKIVQQSLNDGTIVNKFESIARAGRALGVSASSISRACKNNKECKGFHWTITTK